MQRPIRNRSIFRFGITTLIVTLTLASVNDAFAQSGSSSRIDERLLRKKQSIAIPDDSVQLGGQGGNTDWEFPTEPALWTNSGPLTKQALEGKAAVIVFFEEECPNCAERWPAMAQLSQQYQNRPVFFLAVNSGTDPRTLNNYVRKYRVAWPLINDYDRSFENQMGVRQISLQNVVDVRYITADGASHPGKWSDLPATAEAALEGADWRVNPSEVPSKLRNAWRAIEFGSFAEAAKSVTKAVAKEGPLKEAGEKLLDAVQKELDVDYQEAVKIYAEKDKWAAYKQLKIIENKYDGYELPKNVAPALERLTKDEKVVSEVKALQALTKAQRLISRGKNSQAERALKKIVSESAGTEAAEKAQALLGR